MQARLRAAREPWQRRVLESVLHQGDATCQAFVEAVGDSHQLVLGELLQSPPEGLPDGWVRFFKELCVEAARAARLAARLEATAANY